MIFKMYACNMALAGTKDFSVEKGTIEAKNGKQALETFFLLEGLPYEYMYSFRKSTLNNTWYAEHKFDQDVIVTAYNND